MLGKPFGHEYLNISVVFLYLLFNYFLSLVCNTLEMSDREKELRAYYKTLKPCFCPVLGAIIHFNAYGLRHLLYNQKTHRSRSQSERIYRLEQLKYVEEVITKSNKATKLVKSYNPSVITWSLEYSHGKVVVIQRERGRYYFLSTMRIAKRPR
ncbi:hypothetical protein BH11PAT2_BH11PAT2_09420 [soil metagenome]